MVTIQTQRMSVEAFDEFVMLPENRDRLFEYIGGEIIEVVSAEESSEIGMFIGGFMTVFAHQNKLGRTTGSDGGYIIAGERYMPDVAFSSLKKMPKRTKHAYVPVPPDLVVEVLSPSNTSEEMRIKIVNYLLEGVIVWLVDPDHERIEVYAPGQPVKILSADDTLDGGAALPGFTLALRDIFPPETDADA